MKLTKIRVQNYKKIRDTDWISCRDLTVFVGKNEAGKSALFRGLSKLNPSDDEKYDGLKEFPRRRYTDEFKSQDWPVASGLFTLTPQERQELETICPALKGVNAVECTRRYSWKLDIAFKPGLTLPAPQVATLIEAIEKAKTASQDLAAPEGKGPALGTLKTAVLAALNAAQQPLATRPTTAIPTKAEADSAITAATNHANEQWQKDLLQPIINDLRSLAGQIAMLEKYAQTRKWVEDHLPQFIYFDKYDVIESAVHVPTFIGQLNANPQPPRFRTTLCLFKHVGLDVAKLAELGRHNHNQGHDSNVRRQIDERTILSSSASIAMTNKFADWWDQRKHKFHYRVDGDYFRIWVSDDLDPSEIELDQRSAGMQYFFSFFTVFLVEAQDDHKDSILLLDEPGLHLHGTAQAKIIKFFGTLSAQNQTFYTTHSPFMVDGEHLERARAVYEDADGTTKVSEDVWPRDKDTLFPLQAALGYQLAQTLFLSKRQVIVEGITDYWILKALTQVMASKSLPALRDDIILLPSAGVTKLLPLASMLIGHDVEVAALLDGDEPARKEGKKLVEKLLAGQDRKCLFIGDFLANAPKGELEDVFPEADYLSAVHEAYPAHTITLSPAEQAISGIVNKVQALFARNKWGDFNKWKPAAVLRDRILAASDEIPPQVLTVMGAAFQQLNALFPKT
jgi:predicted ATPase